MPLGFRLHNFTQPNSSECVPLPLKYFDKILNTEILRGQVLKYHFLSSRSILLIALLTVKIQGDVFLYHILEIYIYLIESLPAVKRISPFQFFYILILIRQKVYKILLFLKNSCEIHWLSLLRQMRTDTHI
jgi:hypothetical protein